MTHLETVKSVIREIGPVMHLAEVDEIPSEDHITWTLVIDESLVVFVDYDRSATSTLTLSVEVVESPENPLKAFETILLFNNQFLKTGGARMSLDEPGGKIILIEQIGIEDLMVQTLAKAVSDLLEKRDTWKKVITHQEQEAEAMLPSPCMVSSCHIVNISNGMLRG